MQNELISEQFEDEFNNAHAELLVLSEDVGLFDAKKLHQGDMKKRLDEDYLVSLDLLITQVTAAEKYITQIKKSDMTNTISNESAKRMLFATQNYITLCILYFGVMIKKKGEDPNDYLSFLFLLHRLSYKSLNLLSSRDENTPSQILTNDEFVEFGDDYEAMLSWVQSRRFSQVPPSGFYPLTDPNTEYTFSDMGKKKGMLLPILTNILNERCIAIKGKTLQEFLGDNITLERYCNDSKAILLLSHNLNFSLESFIPWLEKALSEQYRNVTSVLNSMLTTGTSTGKRIYREDVIEAFTKAEILPHSSYKATRKLLPFAKKNTVVAIEITKFGSVFLQQKIFGQDVMSTLPADICTIYPAVTPETKPYGRNSNLRQIPELAWCDLVKVRLRNQQDLKQLISLLNRS